VLARDIERTIDEALSQAVAKWRNAGWHRYNDDESNCTMQLFRWLDLGRRTDKALWGLTPRLEWVQPTQAMLEGRADAGKVARPDLRLTMDVEGRTIECKRLRLDGELPRRYVAEGIARFVSGSYASEETRARMVGYIQEGDPNAIIDRINGEVLVHPFMGSGHELHQVSGLVSIPIRCLSRHARTAAQPVELTHHLLEIGSNVT